MKRETLIQLVAATIGLACLALSGGFSASLTNSAGRHRLIYTDTAEEGDPPEVALGIAMGAFRGVFVNWLWFRANDMKEQGQYYEAMELARAITRLQPRFPQVWVFHAWNMAYNISVATNTPEERWQWVQAGIRLLRDEGIRANPNDMLLHKELAWVYLHKVAGVTDDANKYYKRQVAQEWTVVLGSPPARSPALRTREGAVAAYSDWLRGFVSAPDTTARLAESNPAAAALYGRLMELTGDAGSFDLLRRYESHRASLTSIFRAQAEASMGERNRAFAELMEDPRYAEAWPALLAHLRRRLLIDGYNMEPERMVRYTEKYGPIDWRLPAAHALYWSARGVEESLTRWTEENKRDFDFINADRVTIQSLQELYRYGDLYYNFFDDIAGTTDAYQTAPNAAFVETYGEVLEELIDRSWADQSDLRPYTTYAAGYENFLRDAIRFFWRRGQKDLAQEYYHRLGSYPRQNINDPFFQVDVTQPLQEFVVKELAEDRIRSPYVLVSEVMGSLQGAYVNGLLAGDDEVFRESYEWARKAHEYYYQTQVREVYSAGSDTRTGILDPDFRLVAGDAFARLLQYLQVDEAVQVFHRAPPDLRVFAYDFLAVVWKPEVDRLVEAGRGKPFAELFPEPPGMGEHRAYLARVAEERAAKRLDIERD